MQVLQINGSFHTQSFDKIPNALFISHETVMYIDLKADRNLSPLL
jgi:hypothetical protein